MRLTAYKKALEQANELPNYISELDKYFKDSYSPKDVISRYILKKARMDLDLLNFEFVELYTLYKNLTSTIK